MEDNKKNLILALAICGGIIVAWPFVFKPSPPAGPGTSTTDTAPGTSSGDAPVKPPEAGGHAGREGGDTATGAPARTRAPEQMVTLASPDAHYVFTTWGASLRETRFLGGKYLVGPEGKERPLDIVRAPDSERLPFAVSFPGSDLSLPARAAWEVVDRSASHVAFRTDLGKATITKTYRLAAERYRLSLEVAIANTSDAPTKQSLVLHVYGRQDPEGVGSSFLSYATANIGEMACFLNDGVERRAIEGLQEDPFEAEGAVKWVAADERFFTIAAVPPVLAGSRKCRLGGHGPTTGEASVALPPGTAEPDQTLVYPFALYVGPKYRSDLAAVTAPVMPGAAGATEPVSLDQAVNVTFAFLSRPMLALLKLFFNFTGNWGLAIILLTIFVKLVTFYPAHKALMSGKRMAKLAPKLAEIRKKYPEDRERQGRETMALYKTHGVNVLGGCLPSLIQMPVWIALFSTLSYSVELFHSEFFGYIRDLSVPDPYFIAPLIMGAAMYLQMRMSPAGVDPAQQKMMAIMMPVMFTGFSLFLPAGLAIYTLTSYLLGIVHQLLVNHLDKKAGPLVPIDPRPPRPDKHQDKKPDKAADRPSKADPAKTTPQGDKPGKGNKKATRKN
jgi:YidC/Oxa1 family membrane protein insertase